MSSPFAIVPIAALQDDELSQSDKILLCMLCARAGRNRQCWPSTRTIADDLGVSDTRNIKRRLRHLQQRGYIHVQHRENRSSVYTVLFDQSHAKGWSDEPPGGGQTYTDRGGQTDHPEQDQLNRTNEQSPYSPSERDGLSEEGEGEPTPEPSGQPKQPEYPDQFERFWQAYPRGAQGGPNRRTGKPKAYEKWRKAAKRVDPEDLIVAADRYAYTLQKTGKLQFTKMPMGWLNQGMYESYLGDEWEQTRKQLKPPKDDSWRFQV